MKFFQNEVGKIRTMILRDVNASWSGPGKVSEQWQALNYHEVPDYQRACHEYEALSSLFVGEGVELIHASNASELSLDAIYVRDAATLCADGLILCNMGKQARFGEPADLEALAKLVGVPVVGSINGSGRLEGGDICWLDESTIAVGRGYRTNDEGIRQLRELLAHNITELIVVPLPHYKGPSDVFHLMSIFSPVDVQKALVYSPLMPVAFRESLLERGYELIEVPPAEFERMGCNVLAMSPGKCLLLEGCPLTRAALEATGVETVTYSGEEISRKGEGGPTCLTRPLLRDSIA